MRVIHHWSGHLATSARWALLAGATLLLALASGCGGGNSGNDAIGDAPPARSAPSSIDCTNCHSLDGSLTLAASASYGVTAAAMPSATGGPHALHVDVRQYACTACHFDYYRAPTHMDGQLLGPSGGVQVVRFDPANPEGVYTPGTGADAGSCASVACHGGATVSWSPGAALTCVSCHASGSAIDPVALSGSGSAGKHQPHVVGRGFDCETCHQGYKDSPMHANGTLDGGSASDGVVLFGPLNASAVWDSQQGTCASSSCHGAGAVQWFGTGPAPALQCVGCHLANDAINPIALDAAAGAGKHARHVGDKGQDCEACHAGYGSAVTHMNGSLDGQNPGASLIAFDAWNPDASWDAATAGCAGTYCHGASDGATVVANEPTWYTDAPLACTDCHSSGSFTHPLQRDRAAGVSTMHGEHLGKNVACTVCHGAYPEAQTHVDFKFDGGLLDSLVNFDPQVSSDPLNPTAAWINDTGPASGQCYGVCHYPGKSESHGTARWYR